MRRPSLLLPILSTALWAFFASCSEEADQIISPSFSNEREYFESIIANDDFFTTEEPNLEDGDALPPTYGSDFWKLEQAIHPLRFGKKIESVHRSTSYEQQGDTVVIATVTRTIKGKFIVVASYSTGSRHPDTTIQKPFEETAIRKARFVRVATTDRPLWKGWKLDGLSLLKGGTDNTDVTITRLLIRSQAGDSVVVTSPNEFFLKIGKQPHPVPEWHPGDSVTIQLSLMSTSADTETVILRHGASPFGFHRLRDQFKIASETKVGSNYLRVFTLILRGHRYLGKFNAVGEAINHQSIYDDAAPFKNNFWGIPYVVR